MLRRFLVLAALLGAIAAAGRAPLSSDRDMYERIGRHVVVLDCTDIHCFRPLVAVIVEHLPGPSPLKWKAYGVVTVAAAALATLRLCLVLALPARTANLAMWIAAFGYGPLQSIFDPYTSDPLMYLLGPLMTADLWMARDRRAAALGMAGVFAKEFAAAPLWIFTLLATVERRWESAVRLAFLAVAVTLAWRTLHVLLMTLFNYSYGLNLSTHVLNGGYFRVWASALGVPRAGFYLFMAYGPLWILLAAGFARSGERLRRLALCSLPAALAFVYMQQSDRALWNFHFVVIPIAAAVLAELPSWACAAFVTGFAIANLRLGAPQPAAFTWIRGAALAVSMMIAIAAALKERKDREDDKG